ncbi:MAG TPA: hypothetical protein VGL78_05240 [Solirubrobacteraceae bacterium]|jgi:hypothetical protein
MRARDLWERVATAGIAAQGAVPGLYAWGVTVVPVAWVRGGPVAAKVAAIAAPLALGAGVAGERVWGDAARIASLWAFVVASAVTWAAARAGLGPLHVDGPRGVAGMLGWALFAFTCAGPALRGGSDADAPVTPRGQPSGRGGARVEALCVGAGALAAALLQTVGWKVVGTERALLVRFVALAAGLAVLGAATEVALARSAARAPRSSRSRLRGATTSLVALAILAAGGLLLLTAD